MPRKWIKLDCYGRLHGSMNYQLSEAEQSIWDKLLCLAGLCDQDGRIGDNGGKPFPLSHIAHEIHANEKLLQGAISKCTEEGRLTEKPDGLYITNWLKYQSEYQRQKPYQVTARQKAKTNARWERMSDSERQAAIEAFGPIENWDEHTWIAATGKLSDEDREFINSKIQEEGGKPMDI